MPEIPRFVPEIPGTVLATSRMIQPGLVHVTMCFSVIVHLESENTIIVGTFHV
jgi:hypothetical protein